MKIKQLKIINQDESTEIADIGADAVNVDYNGTTVKAELDKLNSDNNVSKNNIANLQSGLNATNSNLALQTSRIDNLAHLDEGSTTGDAELIDGRIGYETGYEFSNLGSSIRNQLDKIDSTLLTNEYLSFNLWDQNLYESTIYEDAYDTGQGRQSQLNYITKTFILRHPLLWYFDLDEFSSFISNRYISITVYPGASDTEQGIRYRYYDKRKEGGSTIDNTMPNINNPIYVPANHLIAITIRSDSNKACPIFCKNTVFGGKLNNNIILNNNQKEQAIDNLVGEYIYKNITVNNLEMNYLEGKSIGSSGSIDTISWIDTYYFTALSDFIIDTHQYYPWSGVTEESYLSIAIFGSERIIPTTFKARYRNNDNTMPSNISIHKNEIVCFSIGVQAPLEEIINFPNNYSELVDKKVIKSDFITEWEKNYVDPTILETKTPCFYYESATSILKIFIPTYVGYIRYDFIHTQSANINANVWRMFNAYAVTDTFEERYPLTARGEWELAVHLKDRDDFSGGQAHGDEIMTNITFFIDGVETDVAEKNIKTNFNEIVIIQNSDLYDPADHTTIIAEHNSEHIFNCNGLKIKQNCIWKVEEELTSCYMAMHLPAKAVTDSFYLNNNYKAGPIVFGTYYGNNEATIYGNEYGVYTKFSVEQYPEEYHFLLTDNGGGLYNKCYYVIPSNGTTTTIGQKWETITNYKFDVNK